LTRFPNSVSLSNMERKQGTTRGVRHARTRDEILGAAREVIVEKGVESFSLREVARRVDYSPAGLYEYFASREDLLAELSAQAMKKLAKAIECARDGDCLGTLLAIGLRYVEFGMNNSQDYLLLFSRMPSSRRSIQEAPGPDNPYSILFAAVLECMKTNTSAEPDIASAEAWAFGLWAMAHGQVMLRLTHLSGFDADFEAAAETTLAAYICGMLRTSDGHISDPNGRT
jgi:AcrR family transcriptional regulator